MRARRLLAARDCMKARKITETQAPENRKNNQRDQQLVLLTSQFFRFDRGRSTSPLIGLSHAFDLSAATWACGVRVDPGGCIPCAYSASPWQINIHLWRSRSH